MPGCWCSRSCSRLARFEVGEIRIQRAVGDREIQALEIVGDFPRVRANRESADDPSCGRSPNTGFGLRIEEILQAHAEHHGDAQERSQCGVHQIALQFREQRGGKAGVLAQLHQSHALAQAQTPDFASNRVVLETRL